jgi:GNAT superfamily N-acetyltransferase
MPGEVSTRPERLPDDGDFLLSVYASTRRPELTGLGWSAKQQDAFIRMQFDAQTRHFREFFPDATYSVICVDGERAGRLIVNRADDQIRIVDIALLPKFRRIGVGGRLVRRLLDQADAGHLPVRCHVLHGSAARRFWEHAGFVAQGQDGVYVAMERASQGRPS